ncbi:MAG: F0F1 ATP synthase subunit A [Acidimicrobiales bacterium]|jgi:F-type H+-transporting ATPase subunit a|nr:F0F1 ATP synthase subunit A [Acidimicrobiales bacterium]
MLAAIMAAEESGGGLAYPPIENLVEWPTWFGGELGDSLYGFNKIALISVLATLVTALLFFLAGRGRKMIPKGMQNFGEICVDFIDKQVVQQAIGHGGEKYIPFLISIFFFVFFGNITEVLPGFWMPANARMANPAFLGLLTLVFFVAVGLKHQGPKYFINVGFPPGVPKPLYILVTPIEYLSTFIVRPFSLAVRLFANMLAGHILLVTFGVLCIALFSASLLGAVLLLSFPMLVALTAFEVMVSFLQAYVFAILAAVYIGGALHPEH